MSCVIEHVPAVGTSHCLDLCEPSKGSNLLLADPVELAAIDSDTFLLEYVTIGVLTVSAQELKRIPGGLHLCRDIFSVSHFSHLQGELAPSALWI